MTHTYDGRPCTELEFWKASFADLKWERQNDLFELQKLRNENKLLNERLSKQAEDNIGLWMQRTYDAEEKVDRLGQELEEVDKALALLAKRIKNERN